jgi:hypothetical protein
MTRVVMYNQFNLPVTCMRDLPTFLFITSARYSRTLSRVSKFLSSTRRISLSPSCKLFITLLIVAKDDIRSAGRREDASEKHCCLIKIKGKSASLLHRVKWQAWI